jgi:hypothetical protein
MKEYFIIRTMYTLVIAMACTIGYRHVIEGFRKRPSLAKSSDGVLHVVAVASILFVSLLPEVHAATRLLTWNSKKRK